MIQATDSQAGWGWVTRLLHWTMAALILFQLGLGLYMTRLHDLLLRFSLTQVHKSWGLVIFVLAMLRLAWRLTRRGRPAMPASMPLWQRQAAELSHLTLYALMLLMPLSGWVLASASPDQDLLQIENRVFGGFALPDPWAPGNEAVADAARTVHVVAALLLAAVLLIHGGAALKHHLVDRDDVLARMTFGK